MERALVVGGSGGIGHALVAELHQRVRALREHLSEQGYPETRRDYLDKQLTGIDMVLRNGLRPETFARRHMPGGNVSYRVPY